MPNDDVQPRVGLIHARFSVRTGGKDDLTYLYSQNVPALPDRGEHIRLGNTEYFVLDRSWEVREGEPYMGVTFSHVIVGKLKNDHEKED